MILLLLLFGLTLACTTESNCNCMYGKFYNYDKECEWMLYEIAFFYLIQILMLITLIFSIVGFFFGKSMFGIYISIQVLQTYSLGLWFNSDYPNNLREFLVQIFYSWSYTFSFIN